MASLSATRARTGPDLFLPEIKQGRGRVVDFCREAEFKQSSFIFFLLIVFFLLTYLGGTRLDMKCRNSVYVSDLPFKICFYKVHTREVTKTIKQTSWIQMGC